MCFRVLRMKLDGTLEVLFGLRVVSLLHIGPSEIIPSHIGVRVLADGDFEQFLEAVIGLGLNPSLKCERCTDNSRWQESQLLRPGLPAQVTENGRSGYGQTNARQVLKPVGHVR